jgi:cytochrome c oxidase subunit 2
LRSFTGSCSLSFVDYLVYFISLNSILLLPCFLGFRFLIFSFDVIHSLGFYSLGFKMDAIPGRINYSFELSTLFKGEHRGFCYELCGTSHSSMLILAMSL